jgi:hypothetical protein
VSFLPNSHFPYRGAFVSLRCSLSFMSGSAHRLCCFSLLLSPLLVASVVPVYNPLLSICYVLWLWGTLRSSSTPQILDFQFCFCYYQLHQIQHNKSTRHFAPALCIVQIITNKALCIATVPLFSWISSSDE